MWVSYLFINVSLGEVDGSDSKQHVRLTEVTRSQSRKAKSFVFDFSDQLLLPWIDQILYSVVFSEAAGPEGLTHSSSLISPTAVQVNLSQPANVMVTVQVRQCP